MKNLFLCCKSLSGSIPKEFSTLKFLEILDFSNNQIEGYILDSFSRLKLLNYFDFSYTNVCVPENRLLQKWMLNVKTVHRSGLHCDVSKSIPRSSSNSPFPSNSPSVLPSLRNLLRHLLRNLLRHRFQDLRERPVLFPQQLPPVSVQHCLLNQAIHQYMDGMK